MLESESIHNPPPEPATVGAMLPQPWRPQPRSKVGYARPQTVGRGNFASGMCGPNFALRGVGAYVFNSALGGVGEYVFNSALGVWVVVV